MPIWLRTATACESDVSIAKRLSVNRNTVILWRKRFDDEGLDGLWDIAPGRGRKPTYQIDKIAGIVDATLQTKPAGMTHWSCRTMAESQGVSKSTVNNIWRAHNLQPHRTQTFKLSRDPKFFGKDDRCRRPVSESSARGDRFVRRRKEPDSGVGPHTAGAADQEGAVVERWFGHLDNKTIRRGVFLSVADLQAAIDTFVTVWNQDPKPFVWTATVESIQEKLTRCRRTLEQIKPG